MANWIHVHPVAASVPAGSSSGGTGKLSAWTLLAISSCCVALASITFLAGEVRAFTLKNEDRMIFEVNSVYRGLEEGNAHVAKAMCSDSAYKALMDSNLKHGNVISYRILETNAEVLSIPVGSIVEVQRQMGLYYESLQTEGAGSTEIESYGLCDEPAHL